MNIFTLSDVQHEPYTVGVHTREHTGHRVTMYIIQKPRQYVVIYNLASFLGLHQTGGVGGRYFCRFYLITLNAVLTEIATFNKFSIMCKTVRK